MVDFVRDKVSLFNEPRAKNKLDNLIVFPLSPFKKCRKVMQNSF